MADLIALAERVEGLAGACRETDVLIVQALYPDIGPCEPHCAGDTPIFWNDPLYKKPCPPLTASLDAVAALIERELPAARLEVVIGNDYSSARIVTGWGAARNRVLAAPVERPDSGAAICAVAATLRALARKEG